MVRARGDFGLLGKSAALYGLSLYGHPLAQNRCTLGTTAPTWATHDHVVGLGGLAGGNGGGQRRLRHC